jgi:hypothetical protein
MKQAGRFTIASGVAGLVGLAFLIAALAAPTPSDNTLRRYPTLFLWQDGWVIAQSLLLFPGVIAVRGLMIQRQAPKTQIAFLLGIIGLLLVSLSLAMIFTGITSDMLYMAPQGLVGMWLLFANFALHESLPRAVTRIGLIAGAGLLIVACGFAVYALLVEPRILAGPLSNAEIDVTAWTPANIGAHIALALGTLIGRSTYPLWTLMLGRELLRRAD